MLKLILVAAVAVAFTSTAAVAADQGKPQKPKEKKVCTVIEPAVGRLPAKRICRTVAEPVAQTAGAQPETRGELGSAVEAASGNQ